MTTGFLYDAANTVQEQGSAGNTNIVAGGIDEAFARTDSIGTLSPIADRLGSVVALTDTAGTIQTQYSYEPFGKTSASGANSANTSQYTGREGDGTGLYYYRARYYSPSLQRFIREDPIGMRGGINLYAYVHNNPLTSTDPLGLADLYYWSPYENSRYGHLAVRLNDGTYISYWPTHEEDFSGKQPLNHRPPVLPASCENDRRGEGDREPERIPIKYLDEAAIKAWWNNGEGHGDFSIWNNCSVIVAEALGVGGFPVEPQLLPYTPGDIKRQAQELGGRKDRKRRGSPYGGLDGWFSLR